MLNDDEILVLAVDLESDRVERKASLTGGVKDRIAEAICAYSNDLPNNRAPGVVLVGVEDNGSPSGLRVTDQMVTTLGALRSDGNILPLPVIVVRKVLLQGQETLAIIVEPSRDPPVRYEGRVWIRVGSRRAVASRDEERILIERRQAGDLPFDRRPIRGADASTLDLDFFRSQYLPAAVSPEVLEANHRTDKEQLLALHLLAPAGEPNAAGVLVLGKDPRAWIPGAYVQFVRFDGVDLHSPILDQRELGGRLPEILREADAIAQINVRVRTRVEGSVLERRHPDYPTAALQQLIRNAIMHRSYEVQAPINWYWFSDRIEIHSPGGLYGRVNEANFGQPGMTDYRNATVAETLKVTGFVQRFGMGVAIARKRCEENGNPPPEFEFSSSSVLVTVRSV